MTTDVEMSAAPDLFSPNAVLRLPWIDGGVDRLAVVRFETRAGPGESRQVLRENCFEAARQKLQLAWPKLTVWLFACHSTWQPKTRLSAHRRLWKALEHSGLVLPSGERTVETPVEDPAGVRFFGEVAVPLDEIDRAYRVLDAWPTSFLVASSQSFPPVIDDRLLTCWRRLSVSDVRTWAYLVSSVCRGGQMLFRPFGFFDDVEVGTDVILEQEAFERLVNASSGSK